VGKPEGKRPLGRHQPRWEFDIRNGLKETGWYDVDLINLTRDRCKLRALVNSVMNLQTAGDAGNFFTI